METKSSLTPIPENGASMVHNWLLKEQNRLAEKVGEPLFVTIRLVYDGFVEVDVQTFTGQQGMAGGGSLPETMTAAVETLLFLRDSTKD